MDAVFDRTGSYRLAIYGLCALLLVSAGLLLLLPRIQAIAVTALKAGRSFNRACRP